VAPSRSGFEPEPDTGDLLLVAAGDDAALTRLVTKWRQPVYSLFERTREPSAALEAALATFERVVAAAPRFLPDAPFTPLIWGLAAKVAQESRTGEVLEIPAAKLAESASARTALVRSAIAALPPGERAAFLLARVARLPVEAASVALGTSEVEVKKRLVRALESLRRTLAPLLEGTPGSAASGLETTASGARPAAIPRGAA
jgi:DNA-directed RNA polymerase specialized sigma24 family protein